MASPVSVSAGRTTLLLRKARLGPGGGLGTIAMAQGRITALVPDFASAEEVATGPGDEVVDLAGRIVLPGLWDAHVHVVQWASARRRIDLSSASSAAAAASVMSRAVRDRPPGPGEPMIGYGFRDGLWPDAPHRDLLAWAPEDLAVVLISNDLHAAWLSSGALATLGRADHPTGVLHEEEALAAVSSLSAAGASVLDGWVADALQEAATRGVTGLIDFEYADNLADWQRRAAAGPLPSRVVGAIYPKYLDRAIAEQLHTGEVLPGTHGMVQAGHLKLFVDGSLNTRTALCAEPYPAAPGEHPSLGRLETGPEELDRQMSRALAHGIASAVHAIGDRANTLALDAFERTGATGRIEHAQLVDPADLPRFARPGLVLGVQPAHAVDDRDVAERHWHGRTHRAFAYAALSRAGATLEFGSDAPVSPMDPWYGIAAAVHRTRDDRASWHPEQAVSLRDALAASARGRQQLRVGDPADLVIIDQDPRVLSVAELRQMPVAGTLVAGRWTHRSDVL